MTDLSQFFEYSLSLTHSVLRLGLINDQKVSLVLRPLIESRPHLQMFTHQEKVHLFQPCLRPC